MTFDVLVLDLSVDLPSPRGNLGNFLRGQLGAALRRSCTCDDPHRCLRTCDYGRIFDPPRDLSGPSGLRDSLRPFVIRASEPGRMSMNLFDSKANSASRIVQALQPSSFSINEIRCDLEAVALAEKHLEIRFLTPTDLRTTTPDFATVFARARDRVSSLRAIYGPGPLGIDFKTLGKEAREIQLVTAELRQHTVMRRSGSTGQRHPLGGFTGLATYQGDDFSKFVPILRAAQYTGVGRKTVWGNGEIALRLF